MYFLKTFVMSFIKMLIKYIDILNYLETIANLILKQVKWLW